MTKKTDIIPERLEQITAIINSRAEWKLQQAQITATNKDEATEAFNDEIISYLELFDSLIDFTSNAFHLFDDLTSLYDTYLRHDSHNKEQIFNSVAMVMALAKEISNKENFLIEQKLHFNNLANELEIIMD